MIRDWWFVIRENPSNTKIAGSHYADSFFCELFDDLSTKFWRTAKCSPLPMIVLFLIGFPRARTP